METAGVDFIPWGLEAAWPSQRWVEPIRGRCDDPPRGVRLAHASDTAMVLVCTYPRRRFDAEVASSSADLLRELAYETTYGLINLALHQIRVPGARPEGLVSSLVQFAYQQADRHRDWATAHWGAEVASVIGLAGWQSGFSVGYQDVYIVMHACGMAVDGLVLQPVEDLSGYELCSDPLELGAMHWELWRSDPALGYEDLARVLVAR